MKLDRLRITVEAFETLTENNANQLVGGFSKSISAPGRSADSLSNNCHGGNCVAGCGSGQNHGACNTALGCGQ